MLKTDWIRAAVEGKTVDGREMKAEVLQQIASSYHRETYHAQIWLEHMRGMLPDGVFKALGSVAEVKAEIIKGGDLDGRIGLYVRLEPAPELVAMVRNGQKLHLSIEYVDKFPTTDAPYLMGVGVTDSPASIGTGIMKFSTSQRPQNHFTAPLSCDLGKCGEQDDMKAIRTLLEKLATQQEPDFKGIPTPPPQPMKFSQQDFDALRAEVRELRAMVQPFKELGDKFEAFMAQDVTPKRPEMMGGDYNNRIVY